MFRKLFLCSPRIAQIANRLSFLLIAFGIFSSAQSRAIAQSITTDGTLGTPQTLIGPNYTIPQSSGQTAGSNLFHSFGRFNLNVGEAATFESRLGIRNIFSRVTGGESSLINGTISVPGQNINLFFINPSGIVFGSNAQVNVTGSFLATTADRITFADGTQFSATAPQSSPVLTVSVPLGLQFGNRPGSIVVQGDRGRTAPILAAGVKQTLALIGGDITMQGGILGTLGGQVEVGSVGDGGFVGLSTIGQNWTFDYARVSNFRDVQLNGQSVILAQNAGVGGIRIHTGTLTLRDGASIQISASEQGRAGNIVIDAKDRVNLIGGNQVLSSILSNKNATADPVGGDIQINTRSLSLTNGAAISAGASNNPSGNITINSFDVASIEGEGQIPSQISTLALDGNAGDVDVQTGRLLIRAGGRVQSGQFIGQGSSASAGNITINARDTVLVDGAKPSIGSSTISIINDPNSNAIVPGKDIRITTGSLSVTNGAAISTSAAGRAEPGNIVLQAREGVTVSGTSDFQVQNPSLRQASPFFSNIVSNTLSPENPNDAGRIQIDAKWLLVNKGAFISSNTNGSGKAGDIVINARDAVTIDGGSRLPASNAFASSRISSAVIKDGTGQGGNIILNTAQLQISDGGAILANTVGKGNAGNIFISARDRVLLTGATGSFFSNISSEVQDSATGNGGLVSIDADSLRVDKGGSISSSTIGIGNAGTIVVNARGVITLDGTDPLAGGSGIFGVVDSGAVGKGGGIQLNARSLSIANGAIISTQSAGQGNAGSISIRLQDRLNANNGNIVSSSRKASGGEVFVQANSIRLRNDSNILTNIVRGDGNGGDILLNANSIVALNDSDILAFAQDGKGGNITLNTRAFFGQNYRPAVAGTRPATLDNNDRVDINASGAISGTITLPDTSFIQNELTSLPETPIDTEALLANSCIRRDRKTGTFYITGTGNLPTRPGEIPYSSYETAEVRSTSTPQVWKSGDAIVEPQGMYTLANGQRVMSRLCPGERSLSSK